MKILSNKQYSDIFEAKTKAYTQGFEAGRENALQEDFSQDIGFAEIQRYFNVYCLNNPIFYQTSNLWTKRSLTSYPMSEYMQYNPVHFKSYKIR